MTKERFFELIEELEKVGDIFVEIEENDIDIDINDFEGFSDDWDEVMRDFVKPELIDELEEFLNEVCSGDYYLYGEVFGYEVCVGYTSMDI